MHGFKRIGIVADPTVPFWKAVIDGVAQYSLDVDDWSLETSWGVPYVARRAAASWRGDGLIGDINPALAAELHRRGVPFVNTASVHDPTPCPSVMIDSDAVGRLAARHLVEKGLRAFAVVLCEGGEPQMPLRARAFRDCLAQRGHSCRALTLEPTRRRTQRVGVETGAIQDYLHRLTEPVGVFAVQDPIARAFIDAVLGAGLRVPEDVAVVGAGDWRFVCELVLPRLTSVDVAADRLGYRAASLLDAILDGQASPSEPMWMPPRGVRVRESTDSLATEDKQVRGALQYIRRHGHLPIQVRDVLQAVSINRRTLEKRFRRQLDRSIYDEIRRGHIERACDLLLTTSLSISHIAHACGYVTLGRFNIAFRREMGVTPSQYRANYAVAPPTDSACCQPADRSGA